MAGNDEMPRAVAGVVDSIARAFWTFVRNGAAFHADLAAKSTRVAEAALSGIGAAPNDPPKIDNTK